MRVPVVGGHSGSTICPLFSQALPKYDLSDEQVRRLPETPQHKGGLTDHFVLFRLTHVQSRLDAVATVEPRLAGEFAIGELRVRVCVNGINRRIRILPRQVSCDHASLTISIENPARTFREALAKPADANSQAHGRQAATPPAQQTHLVTMKYLSPRCVD